MVVRKIKVDIPWVLFSCATLGPAIVGSVILAAWFLAGTPVSAQKNPAEPCLQTQMTTPYGIMPHREWLDAAGCIYGGPITTPADTKIVAWLCENGAAIAVEVSSGGPRPQPDSSARLSDSGSRPRI